MLFRSESTCQQFVPNELYKVDSLWPDENQSGPPSGTYMGLMMDQIKNPSFPPMATAWDWIDNAQAAVAILNEKYPQIGELVSYADKKYSRLANDSLSNVQQESMALGLYSGNAKHVSNLCLWLEKQYDYPTCVGGTVSGTPSCAGAGGHICTGGSWQWQVNTLNPALNTVRDRKSVV